MSPKSVLVTGANGYIGSAVCNAFVRAGWQVIGVVRRPEAKSDLESHEVIPIVANLSDFSFLDLVFKYTKTFEAIVGCTDASDYEAHFDESLAVIRHVAETSNANGKRPLVLWTSGCKDYGMTGVEGETGLTPHVETSPLNAPALLNSRATCSLKILEQVDLFDGVVLRPTNVFGYSSSYFGSIFEYAASEADNGSPALCLVDINPRSIMHAMHVDDCAEAYVALVEHPNRSSVAGQCFNISAHKYETADAVLNALAKEYNFPNGAHFASASPDSKQSRENQAMKPIFGFSQWVSSDKIRNLTGWKDSRMLFTENLSVYRRAYEMAVTKGHEDISRVKERQKTWNVENLTFN